MTAYGWLETSAGRTAVPQVVRYRDLLYWTDGPTVYVIACDSNAGIGTRPADALNKNPTEVGYSAAKVPLMEVVAAGATPFVLTNALGGPLDDYGRRVLAGIEAAISETDADVIVSGSDETNMPTQQTAIGVTVVGRVDASSLRLGTAHIGDVVVVVGCPKDGLLVPYAEGQSDIAGLYDLQAVARLDYVHELLPVGSRGVRYEAVELASAVDGMMRWRPDVPLDLDGSAGASTCFIVALPRAQVPALRVVSRPPVTELGEIVAVVS